MGPCILSSMYPLRPSPLARRGPRPRRASVPVPDARRGPSTVARGVGTPAAVPRSLALPPSLGASGRRASSLVARGVGWGGLGRPGWGSRRLLRPRPRMLLSRAGGLGEGPSSAPAAPPPPVAPRARSGPLPLLGHDPPSTQGLVDAPAPPPLLPLLSDARPA